ncbi:N-6 DNA methylase, partial [bacterium]|nr:N-6 DNA methylase [bacterium]
FSREAVWSGAFDQYAASKRKRGTSEVDAEFLKEIEGWRDVLARNIALRNQDLTSDDLNAAVQSTIDRVVFLRMAEDRRLEPSDQLLKLCERNDIYARFMRNLCRKADEKYNSGLFHFQREADIDDEPDRITPTLAVDDKVFKPILQSLYFAHGSPYHFGVMPIEILGTVYERFLGKVIRLTAGHQAKVEEKPEVRKAGGVYYTPSFIVDYIVEHTVGRRIAGRSPAQLAGLRNGKQPLRVLDMACGSGSFLLGAYQRLLDHCVKWYSEHSPVRHKQAVYKDPRNAHWRLTIGEKKRILTTHIFGVDIDTQAVEVTKLSLLLKVLEGETDQSVSEQLRLFHDRALPNLADNIKCGNSLIGPDYFTGKLVSDPEEMRQVNPFDWKQRFPEAMKAGGFDVVVGNPPYGRDILSKFRDYFEGVFETLQYKVDSFVLFLERGATLLNRRGKLGYILPNTWLTTERFSKLRHFLLTGYSIETVVNLGKGVFADANIDTMLIVFGAGQPGVIEVTDASSHSLGESRLSTPAACWQTTQHEWMANPGGQFEVHAKPALRKVFSKVVSLAVVLGELAEVSQGLIPYNTKDMSRSNPYMSPTQEGPEWKRLLDKGACIGRYRLSWNGVYVKYGPWLYTANQPKFYESPKILVQRHRNPSLQRRVVATFDGMNHYFKDNLC